MYVIKCGDKFFGIDQGSGGQPFWSSSLLGAQLFHTFNNAENIFESKTLDDSEESRMSDGTSYPTSMIHSALDLSNNKESGEGLLTIEEVQFRAVRVKRISGKIKRYTYAEED
jgi:hypothetical protein